MKKQSTSSKVIRTERTEKKQNQRKIFITDINLYMYFRQCEIKKETEPMKKNVQQLGWLYS